MCGRCTVCGDRDGDLQAALDLSFFLGYEEALRAHGTTVWYQKSNFDMN